MTQKKKFIQQSELETHQFYLDIINSMPDIVYWIDINGMLSGCNNNFVNFFGLNQTKDFSKTPYDAMMKSSGWSKERVDAFRLDDLKVLFSGVPTKRVEEAPVYDRESKIIHYLSNRVPLWDKNKKITGLVVVLTDITVQKYLEVQDNVPQVKDKKSLIEQLNITEPHVLMVEDNLIAQKIEEALLTDLHCHVDIAESGDQALSLFDPGKYDIVFMDIGLEDTSGYMVAKKLRQMEKDTNFHVPIIALTSYKADVVEQDCHYYQMDGVLTKPITSEQAQQIIQHFIYHEDIPIKGLK